MLIHVVTDASFDQFTKRAVGAAQILKHEKRSLNGIDIQPEEVLLENLGEVQSSLTAELITSVLATRVALSYGLPIVVHSDLHGIKKWFYGTGRSPAPARQFLWQLKQMNPILVIQDANYLLSYEQCHDAAYRELFKRDPKQKRRWARDAEVVTGEG